MLQGGANCVKFSRNGEFFASGSADEQVNIYIFFVFRYSKVESTGRHITIELIFIQGTCHLKSLSYDRIV